MRLTQIRDFLAVVDAGSIRSAARKLGVSQPAISKSVRSLEAELRIQLVQRMPNGIALTRSGRAFLARARVAQMELNKAVEEAAQLDGEGSVAFGVGPVAAFRVVPEAVSRFREQFPHARVRVTEGLAPALMPLVLDESLDFGMGPRPAKLDPAFKYRPLIQLEHVVVARKGNPFTKARSIADLVDADWLDLAKVTDTSGPLERMFAAARLPAPRQVVNFESYNTIVAMVAKSDMIAFFPQLLIGEFFDRDLLQEIKLAERAPPLNITLFTRAGSQLAPMAAAMAAAVTAVARGLTRRAQ